MGPGLPRARSFRAPASSCAFRTSSRTSSHCRSRLPGRTTLGARLFKTHCATCHGVNGRGNGPLADQLRRPPPDLTKFTARNGGLFPDERLRRIIDGRDVPSHGDRDMPVWGDVFRDPREGRSSEAGKGRVDAIVGTCRASRNARRTSERDVSLVTRDCIAAPDCGAPVRTRARAVATAGPRGRQPSSSDRSALPARTRDRRRSRLRLRGSSVSGYSPEARDTKPT